MKETKLQAEVKKLQWMIWEFIKETESMIKMIRKQEEKLKELSK